jgi:tetratricopeptide (TPR) repeat protein
MTNIRISTLAFFLVAGVTVFSLAQGLNLRVTSLRFFEGGYSPPPLEQRVYSNRFDKSKTRYVNWELKLEFPAPGRRVSFPIEQFWYRADGSLVTRQTWQASIEPNWTWSYHNHGYGRNNPDNWGAGPYRVDLYVEGQKLASGSFEIYEAASADTYFSRGIDFRKIGMLKEAIAEFTKAIEINPKYAEAYYNRGLAYFLASQPDQAISDYTKAIEIDPKHAGAYANRGVTYYYKGEYDKAWDDVHKAQGLGAPMDPEILDKLRKASGREG